MKYLEKYFENTNIKYYEPKILITILEDILGKDISTIKTELDELKITVNSEQIVEYLNNKFLEEEPEVKERIETLKTSKPVSSIINLGKASIEDIEKSAQRFEDQLTASRYGFDSYTLDYFHKFSNIVRKKAIKILDIIEKIVNKDSTIDDLLMELDIQLDENRNIIKEDIIRLIPPFIHNYNLLVAKVNAANNLKIYLTFKLSKYSLYRDGISEGEIYPRLSIQTKSLYHESSAGNIPLSNNQKKILLREENEYSKKIAKTLLNW